MSEHLLGRRAEIDLGALTPSARISRQALPLVRSVVAKPAAYSQMFLRGSFS
jgi:hypothetical protein